MSNNLLQNQEHTSFVNTDIHYWRNKLIRHSSNIRDGLLPEYLQYPRPLIENPLPRTDVGQTQVENNDPINRYRVMITGCPQFGIINGTMARILIAYSTTLMFIHKNRTVSLAANNKSLLKLLGFSSGSGGGKRGTNTRLKNALNQLIRTTIQFEENNTYMGKQVLRIINGPFDYIETSKKEYHDGEILLTHSEAYSNFCLNHGTIPLDTKTLLAFSHSTYQTDIYALLVLKALSAPKYGIQISWRKWAETLNRPNKIDKRKNQNIGTSRIKAYTIRCIQSLKAEFCENLKCEIDEERGLKIFKSHLANTRMKSKVQGGNCG